MKLNQVKTNKLTWCGTVNKHEPSIANINSTDVNFTH